MHVAPRTDGADAVAALALGPGEVMAEAELAADERGLLLAEAEPAALAGLADDGEISCRAQEDDRLLEQLQSPPDRLRRRRQVGELCVSLEERKLDGAGGTVSLLGDLDLGKPLLVAF